MVEDFQKLAEKAVTWVTSIIIKADELDIESNRQEVLSVKSNIEQNPLYSDNINDEVEKVLDAYEQQVEDEPEFNPVSERRRKIKYK
jgi:Mg2+/Co2+ transporter CorC